MKKIYKLFFGFLLAVTFFSCSSSQQTSENEEKGTDKKEGYVFDEFPDDSTKPIDKQVQNSKKSENENKGKIVIQIGAFTSKEKADEFVTFSKKKLNREVNSFYNKEVELFVVQIGTFITKEEAEKVKNELWKTKEFKDAFIIYPVK